MAWFFDKGFKPGLYEIASILITCYEESLTNIIIDLKFKQDFNLEEKFKELNYFIQFQKSAINQIPRRSEIKDYIEELMKHIEKILNVLCDTLPIVADEFDKIYDNVYPHKKYKDITLSTQTIQLQLQRLKAICLSISKKIGFEFSNKLIDSVNAILNCLRHKDATINGIINFMIPLEKVIFNNNGFISSLKQNLKILLDNCPNIINLFGQDPGGRKIDSLARSFLLKLAFYLEEATGKKPTAYKSSASSSGYDGSLYRFAMMCAPLFKSSALSFLNHPASIGNLSFEMAPHYTMLMENKRLSKS